MAYIGSGISRFNTADELTVTGDAVIDTTTLVVDSTNNRVGIGTASPSETLHVEEATTGNAVRVSRGGNYIIMGGSGSGTQYVKGYEGTIAFGNAFAGNTTFLTSDTERMRIDSSGNVGIGTASPSSVLHLSTSNDPKITLTDTGFGASADITGSNGNLRLNSTTATLFDMAGSEVARIDSSGNLLVGTTDTLPAINNVEGIALSAGSFGGRLEVSRDNNEAVSINRKTSNGSLMSFKKDGTTVGSIGSFAGNSYFAGSGCGLRPRTGDISPTNASGSTNDGGVDLGTSSNRFNNILLSGGVYLGGTGSANALDDYEEGTWTPSFNLVTVTHTAQYGRYVKIGKMVHLKGYISVSSIDNTDVSGIQMTVPISANSATSNGSRGCTFAHDAASSTLLDGSHASVQGAYVSGTTFAITNTGGGNFTYNQLTQSSGVFTFAFTYEAA